MLSFQQVIGMKIINISYILFAYKVFEIRCVFYNYSISQFGPVTFQVFSNHILLVATILDSTDIDIKNNIQKYGY